jgi:hypothetical protein
MAMTLEPQASLSAVELETALRHRVASSLDTPSARTNDLDNDDTTSVTIAAPAAAAISNRSNATIATVASSGSDHGSGKEDTNENDDEDGKETPHTAHSIASPHVVDPPPLGNPLSSLHYHHFVMNALNDVIDVGSPIGGMESGERGPSPREDVVTRPDDENPLTAPLHTLVSLAGTHLPIVPSILRVRVSD